MEGILSIVSFIYIPLSYSLYLLIIYIIFAPVSRKHFQSGFYRIFVMQAVMGLIYNFTYTLCIRGLVIGMLTPLVNVIPTSGFFCTLPYVLLYHGGAALTFLDTVLSYNRLSIFILKSKYQVFWKKAIPRILVGIILVPNLTTWHFWFINVQVEPFVNGYVWNAENPENVPWMKSAIITVVIISVCSTLALINNVLTISKLINLRKVSQAEAANYGHFDRKLFVYSLLIFFGHLVSLIIQILFYLDTNEVYSYELFFAQVFSTDFVSLGPAWCLLLMSVEIKKQIAILCGFHKFTVSTTMSWTVSTNSNQVRDAQRRLTNRSTQSLNDVTRKM